MPILNRYNQLKQEIQTICEQSNRPFEDVTVVAVTKAVSIDRTREAVKAGLIHLGENRLEGLFNKKQAIQNDNVKWHFIGSLQTRKVKDVINEIDYLHSLDRMSLAEEIEKRALKTIRCFVQVNVSGEQSKHGLLRDEVIPFIENLQKLSKIQVVGLMTMAPNTSDEKILHEVFHQLKIVQESIQQKHFEHAPCTELSMGMSNDYSIAIEEGATFVRIGTALVGEESEETL